uniref:HSF-type DNA-binding domain-containing protein n=1 Tax=Aquila chrysaetos chrysaetos TaxID=223781 RepID=A0A663FBR3_AQUCH
MPTAKHHFGLTLTRESERELSPGELSSASALDEFLESADSTVPVPPGWDKRTPCDAALTSIRKEKDFQACNDDRKTNKVHLHLEESCGEADDFASFAFPKKVWRIYQSHLFQSLRWVDDGICVAISEEPFQKEVLAQRQPHRVFDTHNMKSFLHQLHLYRFTKVQWPLQNIWLTHAGLLPLQGPVLLSWCFPLLFYYNPSFKRDDPHLLERCKQRVGHKRRATAAFSLGPALKENYPRSSPEVQPGGGGGGGGGGRRGATAAVKPHTPSLVSLQCSQAPPGLPQAASAAPAPSPSHSIPPVNNWTPCTGGLGLPAFPPLELGMAALQAAGAALPPFWHPWFPMVLHAGSSLCSGHARATARPNPSHPSLPKPCQCRQKAGTPPPIRLDQVDTLGTQPAGCQTSGNKLSQ